MRRELHERACVNTVQPRRDGTTNLRAAQRFCQRRDQRVESGGAGVRTLLEGDGRGIGREADDINVRVPQAKLQSIHKAAGKARSRAQLVDDVVQRGGPAFAVCR